MKDDLGQEAKEKPEKNGENGTNGAQEFDTLELRNRWLYTLLCSMLLS